MPDDVQRPAPIQPLDQPKSGKAKLAATVGVTAAGLLMAFVGQWEGKSNDPYQDIVGVWTVCHGETNVPMHHYTDDQCDEMFANALAEYAAPVIKRNPELAGHPYQLSAAVSLEYNIGESNYARSTVSKRFSQGRWRQACDAFLPWDRAGGRVVPGLLNRRKAERAMCLTGLR